jgi:hypothetical protein
MEPFSGSRASVPVWVGEPPWAPPPPQEASKTLIAPKVAAIAPRFTQLPVLRKEFVIATVVSFMFGFAENSGIVSLNPASFLIN